jgi:D-3-phosphoglycerate dehydrogenase
MIVGIVNCARGGVDEVALVKLRQRKSFIRRLRCFESEPKPEMTILMHPKVSLTHTLEQQLRSQDRIGTELASQIISLLK